MYSCAEFQVVSVTAEVQEVALLHLYFEQTESDSCCVITAQTEKGEQRQWRKKWRVGSVLEYFNLRLPQLSSIVSPQDRQHQWIEHRVQLECFEVPRSVILDNS
ncbi:PREDICTED: uncharacterized protein LOC101314117 [Fragaria vesca subsp. vesca]